MEFIDREAGAAILLLFRKIAHQWGVGGERQKILQQDDYLLTPAELVDEPLASMERKRWPLFQRTALLFYLQIALLQDKGKKTQAPKAELVSVCWIAPVAGCKSQVCDLSVLFWFSCHNI